MVRDRRDFIKRLVGSFCCGLVYVIGREAAEALTSFGDRLVG